MRLHISSDAEKLLLDARTYLIAKACKATPSGVASKALEIFFNKYFENEKKNMEKTFFDKKSYIKDILDNSCEDDEALKDSLRELILKMKPAKPVRKRAKTKTSMSLHKQPSDVSKNA